MGRILGVDLMRDRKAYMAQYYIKNKPNYETRRALSIEKVYERRKKRQEYLDRLNPPSEKALKIRAKREAYQAARAAS